MSQNHHAIDVIITTIRPRVGIIQTSCLIFMYAVADHGDKKKEATTNHGLTYSVDTLGQLPDPSNCMHKYMRDIHS